MDRPTLASRALASPSKAAPSLQQNRVAGYCGYIPGLPYTLTVNTTEYAQYEYESRPDAQQSLTTGSAEYRDRLTESLNRTTSGSMSTTIAKASAPRVKIMGYKGYIPGLPFTCGVVNADYQNEECQMRKTNPGYRNPRLSTSQGTDTESPRQDLVSKYHERANQVLESERTTVPADGNDRPSSRNQLRSGGSQRSSSQPISSRPTAHFNPARQAQLELSKKEHTVDDYLDMARASTFSGYIPRKKFIVGI